MAGTLSVEIDGSPLSDEDARAFWARFSAWMDAHAELMGDIGGFARSEGLTSVHPEMHDGMPMLVGSRTAPQRPYTTAARKSGGNKSGGKRKRR